MKFELFVLFTFCCGLCIDGKTINPKKKMEKLNEGKFETGEDGQSDFDKEVLWGDDDGHDTEDDILDYPEEKQKEKLKNLVEKKMDVNQDGFLSLEELVAWTEKSFDSFETEESRYEFPELDSNEDKDKKHKGLLTWEEVAADRFGEFNELSDDYQNVKTEEWIDYRRTYDKDKKLFEAADIDNSGALDIDEYLIFKHPRLHEKTTKLTIQDALEKSDKNNDGQIDMNEYLGKIKLDNNNEEPEWVEHDRERFLDFDKDKSGALEGNEIMEWVAPSNKEAAAEEAEHLMTECDENGDGKLTSDEIIENHELWLESDATDYGAQLLKNHDEL